MRVPPADEDLARPDPLTVEVEVEVEGVGAAGAEVDGIARALRLPLAHSLTLLFSAKEAIFKCLFSEVRRYFAFRDVWISPADVGQLDARLLVSLSPLLVPGHHLSVRYLCEEHLVHTGALRPAA